MLTDEQKVTYVASGGADCPYCEAGAAETVGKPWFLGPHMRQARQCCRCGAAWTDAFTLTSIEEDES